MNRRKKLLVFTLVIIMICVFTASIQANNNNRPQVGSYQLIIENGTIMDPGSGMEFVASIGIKDGKITDITTDKLRGGKVIDASGLIVSPGFIDIHTHVEGNLFGAEVFARQGVTTVLGANCGEGVLNTERHLDELEFPINLALLVGERLARREIGLPRWNDVPTLVEIEEMREIMRKELEGGALAISMGLEYVPFAPYEEVLMTFELAAEYETFVISHVREDAGSVIKAIDEMAYFSQLTGAPVIITHLAYMAGFGQMTEALERIDYWRSQGVKMGSDSGVYWSFAIDLQTAIFNPGWKDRYNATYSDLLILSGEYAGQWCTEDLFYELREVEEGVTVAAFVGKEEECAEALDHVFAGNSYVMLSSDGSVESETSGHPQGSGTNPRFLAWVREGKLKMSLMEAIAKMTLYPAEWMGLRNKGRIQVGADADITIFDFNTVKDNADIYVEGSDVGPATPPDGIEYVIVNGVIVVVNGELTGELPGKGIKRVGPPLVWPEWAPAPDIEISWPYDGEIKKYN